MAYGDVEVGVALRTQTAAGVPRTTFTDFWRVIGVSNVSGSPEQLREQTINTGLTKLKPIAGKINNKFTMRLHMTCIRAMKAIAASIGAVSTAGIGDQTITIVAFGGLAGDSVTVNLDGSALATQTEGVTWTAGTSNDATATSLAAAINALAGVSASAVGAVVTIVTDDPESQITFTLSDSTNMTAAGSGAYRHTITPSGTAANTRRFTMQFDVNGRIYTHMDVQPLGWRLSMADAFMDLEIDFGSRWVSHVQFSPTATSGPATYTGVLYTAGAYYGSDDAAVTYNLKCSTSGVIGNGTTPAVAQLQTKLSTDGGYGTARLVYMDVPFELLSQAGVQSGIFVIFSTGGNMNLANTDTWTISTRDTVAAPTITTNTVFRWNSEEFSRIWLNGSPFAIPPKTFATNYDRGLSTSDFGGGSRVPLSHDRERHADISGQMDIRIRDATYMNWSWNNVEADTVIRATGQQIGSSLRYERVEWTIPQFVVQPIGEDLDGQFLKYWPVRWDGYGSNSTLDDFLTLIVQNNQSSLVT